MSLQPIYIATARLAEARGADSPIDGGLLCNRPFKVAASTALYALTPEQVAMLEGAQQAAEPAPAAQPEPVGACAMCGGLCFDPIVQFATPAAAQKLPPLPTATIEGIVEDLACCSIKESRAVSSLLLVAQAYGDARAAAERDRCDALRADAEAIFNDPPSETTQDVRDVIEWYDAAIRAATQERGAR